MKDTTSLASKKKLPSPEPAAGLLAYQRERELALAYSPRRRENYERYSRSVRRSAEVDYLPVVLDIENVSRCNFRCIMCDISNLPKGKRAVDLSLDSFRKLIDEQYGLVEIKLHGLGEPLLQGEQYFEMIKYARAQHIWVRTVTNGSALKGNDNYKKLIDTGINEVQVSIDGADKETFEKIRRGSKFELVAEGAKLLNDYCRQKNRLITKMWTMVQRDNMHQLEALVDLAHSLGFSSQTFSLHMHGFGSAEMISRNAELVVESKLSSERLEALVERGKQKGVTVSFWNVHDKYDWKDPEKLCPWPFERAYIASDVRTVPCCMVSNPDRYEIGRGKSFTEAWNSDEYAAFRRAHLTGNLPEVCKACYRTNTDKE